MSVHLRASSVCRLEGGRVNYDRLATLKRDRDPDRGRHEVEGKTEGVGEILISHRPAGLDLLAHALGSLGLNGDLMLYGVVDPWEIRALDVIAALGELQDRDTITIRVNSPGGSVYEGLAIYDAIRMTSARGKKIVVRIDALAASIASVIAMAADELVFAEDARLMIHNPFTYAAGESEDLRKLADELDHIRDRLVTIYSRKAGNKISPERLVELMNAETYLSAAEALSFGLGDRIDVPLKVAARSPDTVNRTLGYLLASPSIAAEAATQEYPMSTSQTAAGARPNSPPAGVVQPPSPTPEADALNRAREAVREIYNVVRIARLDTAIAEDMLNRGLTLDQARAEVFDMMANAQPQGQRQHISVSATPQHDRKPFADALYATMTGRRPEGPAAQFAGMSPLDLGAARLRALGRPVPTSRDQLFNVLMGSDGFMNSSGPGMHTTSDFPVLLQDAGGRVLLDGYRAAQSAFKAIARRRTATDFRAISSVRLSDPAPLTEVPESGEITNTTRTEIGESFALKTYAKMFSVSRQALLNDDLGAFADTLSAFGRSAAETEAQLLAGLFTANGGNGAKLADGVNLFDAIRGNKSASGTALSVTSLGAARAAMRTTKGIDGITVLGLTPAYLVVGPALETEAEQILATINAAKSSDANPWSGKLTLLVEPRITDRSWRVFADPAVAPVIAIAFLNGVEAPLLEMREGWRVLGTEFRAVLDFGCAIQQAEGAFLNPGA